jgi:hypothetical protein
MFFVHPASRFMSVFGGYCSQIVPKYWDEFGRLQGFAEVVCGLVRVGKTRNLKMCVMIP